MQRLGKFILMTLSTTILLVSMTMPAMGADVTGSWAMTVVTDAGSGMMSIVLEQEGDVVKGSITGDAGNASVNGKVENEVVTFGHSLPEYGVSANYSGALAGNTIKGTVDFADGAATGTFTAERKE
ncbi:MAG: hypothetical protein HQ498_12315 [Pseudohongiella sp.]|nr:hypothetical protein [Pseudohongiella sp.]